MIRRTNDSVVCSRSVHRCLSAPAQVGMTSGWTHRFSPLFQRDADIASSPLVLRLEIHSVSIEVRTKILIFFICCFNELDFV